MLFGEFDKISMAVEYADDKHRGQLRKYTETPYITHPMAVLMTLQWFTYPVTVEVACASVLHDVVEDTDATFDDITELFGSNVSRMVYYCSHIATKEDGNRATRVQKNIEHYMSSHSTHTYAIKIADAIHNCRSIKEFGKGFYYQYVKEKTLLIDRIFSDIAPYCGDEPEVMRTMIEYFKQTYTLE